jgi:hypothetical protein
MSPAVSRNIFYGFLAACFLLGVFFKQFDLFSPTHLVLAAISFSGVVGLLWEYAWNIRKSIWALIPLLAATEFFGDLVYNADLKDFAFYIYAISMFIFPVYGVLFVKRGLELWHSDRRIGWEFVVLGLLAFPPFTWEIATFFPTQIQSSHLGFRILFLLVIAWLLVIDFTIDFSKRPQLVIERQIVRISLWIMCAWFFARFVFK